MRLILCLSLLISSAFGQQTFPSSFQTFWEYGIVVVPNSSTAVCGAGTSLPCGQTVHLDTLVLANTTGSAVTVTLTDNSTNCGGSPCQIFSAVSVAANQTYIVDLKNVIGNGGVKWSASSVTAIHGYIRGRF